MQQTAQPAATVPFEYASLLERCLGKKALVGRLIVKFRESFWSDFAGLQRALADRDSEALTCVAHRMKGSCANMSTPRLRAWAAEIERLARAKQVAEVHHCLEELRGEWGCFERSLPVLDLPDAASWRDVAGPDSAREQPCAC